MRDSYNLNSSKEICIQLIIVEILLRKELLTSFRKKVICKMEVTIIKLPKRTLKDSILMSLREMILFKRVLTSLKAHQR